MKAPFIWFGGKRRVAADVWDALGDVDNYVEPFAGSLAVLLARPGWHRARCETVNDADRFLANFWRALATAPDEVARWADWPVNECDLFARHMWLVSEGRARLAGLEADPLFYDAQVAGWWVWGLNSWIGSGWCSGDGPWTVSGGEVTTASSRTSGTPGRASTASTENDRKLPHLGDAGRGVTVIPPLDGLYAYFRQLAARLRGVRVCCGDWSRIVTDGALAYGASVGVFLDPPYALSARTGSLYAVDQDVSAAARDWALGHGDDPRYRIVLAGYDGEHEMPATWRMKAYSASRAYGGGALQQGVNAVNRHRERLWFSPHCRAAAIQADLFSGEAS